MPWQQICISLACAHIRTAGFQRTMDLATLHVLAAAGHDQSTASTEASFRLTSAPSGPGTPSLSHAGTMTRQPSTPAGDPLQQSHRASGSFPLASRVSRQQSSTPSTPPARPLHQISGSLPHAAAMSRQHSSQAAQISQQGSGSFLSSFRHADAAQGDPNSRGFSQPSRQRSTAAAHGKDSQDPVSRTTSSATYDRGHISQEPDGEQSISLRDSLEEQLRSLQVRRPNGLIRLTMTQNSIVKPGYNNNISPIKKFIIQRCLCRQEQQCTDI